MMLLHFYKNFLLAFLATIFFIGCSIGTSFKSYDVKSFKGVSIPELSNEPILIEQLSMPLINQEKQKKPLNLPLNLLKYSPSSYKVGPGDKLFIYVYGETERLSAALARGAAINPVFEKIIRDDGTIFYPNAGILDVNNLTVEEIRLLLTDALSDVLNNPQVDVSVSDFKSKKAVVSGNFSNVGPVAITSIPQTLSEVISTANPFGQNGAEPQGDLTSINFTRDGLTYSIDYEYLARNSQLQNLIYIKDGDVIHMPDNSLNKVHVIGEAASPTSLRIKRENYSFICSLSGSQRT